MPHQTAAVAGLPRTAVGRPLVSVVMSMRDSAATVGPAIRSVQLQTLEDWEFIIIDDGSTDNGASIVRACDDPRIHLVQEASGAGLAARLNQAVGLSRGEFIARMDADDICFPDRLARQVARLRDDPQLDLLGCRAVVFTSDARLIGELPIGLTHQEIVADPSRGFPLPHPTWCGRAEWFRNNPYDPKLMKTQDQELLLRSFGHSKFAGLTDVLVAYRQDALELRKTLLGRKVFIQALWRHARHSGKSAAGLAGIGGHVLKAGADILTVGLGFKGLAQRGRLRPVNPSIAQQWQGLHRKLELTQGAI